MGGIFTLSGDPLKDIHATGTLVSMKYRPVMEFLTPETTDGLGVASFVESGEKVMDVVRVRLGVVGHRLDQLFNQGVLVIAFAVGSVIPRIPISAATASGTMIFSEINWSRLMRPARERKMSGEALIAGGSATLEFLLQAV